MGVQKKSSAQKKKTYAKRESGAALRLPAFSAEEFSGKAKVLRAGFLEAPGGNIVNLFAEQGLKSPLVFLGTEALRIRRSVSWIRETFFSGADSSAVNTFHGGEITNQGTVQNIMSSLRALSLFSSNQLLIIYDAELAKAASIEKVVEELNTGVTSTLVVLTFSSVPARSPFKNLTVGSLITAKELDASALKRWIQKEAVQCGASAGIEPGAIELLAKCYGNDISALAQEISKLALLTDTGKPITKELATQIINRSPENTSFELVNQIARKNVIPAVILAKKLLDQGLHPLQLSNFLTRSTRMLLANKSKTAHGNAPLHSELSNPWFLRNLSNALQLTSEGELASFIGTLKKLDLELKSNNLPHTLAITLAAQEMAVRAGTGQK